MSVGFRKTLFGFNCDDVCDYIQKTHKSYVEKETVLNEQIEALNESLTKAKLDIEDLLNSKSQIEAELKKYTDKYDEIERLSQNIGKLYLVSKANAQSVIDNAKESKALAEGEISKNISCVDETQTSLAQLKEEINKTASEFTNKLNTLMISLENTKATLNSNILLRDNKLEEYQELLDSVNS